MIENIYTRTSRKRGKHKILKPVPPVRHPVVCSITSCKSSKKSYSAPGNYITGQVPPLAAKFLQLFRWAGVWWSRVGRGRGDDVHYFTIDRRILIALQQQLTYSTQKQLRKLQYHLLSTTSHLFVYESDGKMRIWGGVELLLLIVHMNLNSYSSAIIFSSYGHH
jgi:hypothetical protein